MKGRSCAVLNGHNMPSTSKGKHSEGAGKRSSSRGTPGGGGVQRSFSILGKIGWKLLSRKNKGGWDSPRSGQ